MSEPKQSVRIVALKQGFVMSLSDFEDDDLAFTDTIDLAKWLLEWLGLELPGFEELRGFEHDAEFDRVLGVAEAAYAFVEDGDQCDYDKLAEAVNKWRGIL